jgi:rhamnose utilization protein RhaD (predicted bifunctional aldolase and dehydrogenase)
MHEINTLSYMIGSQPSLTQGAGGNVSVKLGESMLVKSSGKLMSTSLNKDIWTRVKIDDELLSDCLKHESEPIWTFQGERPSIETSFHMYFATKYVVHYHPMHLMPELTKVDFYSKFSEHFHHLKTYPINYVKPGIKITKKLSEFDIDRSQNCVVLLQNHGIIIASDCIREIIATIAEIELYAVSSQNQFIDQSEPSKDRYDGFIDIATLIPNFRQINKIDDIEEFWALTPDHLVFLGPKPIFLSEHSINDAPYFFNHDGSVFLRVETLNEQLISLLNSFCFTVSAIHKSKYEHNFLNQSEIYELLNWDAEHYRKKIAETNT